LEAEVPNAARGYASCRFRPHAWNGYSRRHSGHVYKALGYPTACHEGAVPEIHMPGDCIPIWYCLPRSLLSLDDGVVSSVQYRGMVMLMNLEHGWPILGKFNEMWFQILVSASRGVRFHLCSSDRLRLVVWMCKACLRNNNNKTKTDAPGTVVQHLRVSRPHGPLSSRAMRLTLPYLTTLHSRVPRETVFDFCESKFRLREDFQSALSMTVQVLHTTWGDFLVIVLSSRV